MTNTSFDTTQMTCDEFIELFGGVYEHSPWIAEQAFKGGLNEKDNQPINLAARMEGIVDSSSQGEKLKLLKAHPELAGKLAIKDQLTTESKKEQGGAGLDACSKEEFEAFQRLNAQYNEKFGFPFIIAVKGLNRSKILEAFRNRVNNREEDEFHQALSEVHKIARLRILDLMKSSEF